MKRSFNILLTLWIAACGLITPAPGVSLEEINQLIAANNRDLVAARFMIEEAKGRHLGAGRLMNPEIEANGRRISEGREGK